MQNNHYARVSMKVFNIIVIAMMVFSLGGGLSARVSADTSDRPAIMDEDKSGPIWQESRPPNFAIVPQLYDNTNVTNRVLGNDWPAGATITLQIDDPDNGISWDYTDTLVAPDHSTGFAGYQFEFNLSLTPFLIEAGMLVRMSDGTTTEEYTVSTLKPVAADYEADTINGLAPAGAVISATVYYFGPSSETVKRWVTANASGYWAMNFAYPGTDPHDEGTVFDLQFGNTFIILTQCEANDFYEAGQCTKYWWNPPYHQPIIDAKILENQVLGSDWPIHSSVNLTIDDPSTGVGIDFSQTQLADSNYAAAFNDLGGLTLAPGMLLSMTDGSYSKTLTISNLAVTNVDNGNDTVSGTGTAAAQINIKYCDGTDCSWNRYATIPTGGTWQVDFSTAGTRPDEQRILNITPGMGGKALEIDADGDITDHAWYGPRPWYVKADYLSNSVHAYGWPLGTNVTLTINNYPGHTLNAKAANAPWDPNSPIPDVVAIFDLGAYDLQAADILTVSGGGHTESYTVPSKMTRLRWFMGINFDDGSSTAAIEQQVIDDFNLATPDMELIHEVQPSISAVAVLRDQISAGNPPDIVGPTGPGGYNKFHGWLDLEPLIHSTGFDTSVFSQPLMDIFKTEEGQIGLPFTVNPSALYYVPSMFDAAGLNYPPAQYGDLYEMPDHSTVEWNWTTLAQVAKLLTLDGTGKNSTQTGFDPLNITQYGFTFGWAGHPNLWGSYFQAGRLLQGGPGGFSAAIPAAWKEAWQWVYEGTWGAQPFIPNTNATNTDLGGFDFGSGKVAMHEIPAWILCCLSGSFNTGKPFQIGAMPSYEGQVAGRIDADTFLIRKDSLHPAEAFEALTYLVLTGVQKLVVGSPEQRPAYSALPAIEALRQPYFDNSATQYPFVTQGSWDVLKAGVDFPDLPGAESYVPNLEDAWARINTFGNLLKGTGGLDLQAEEDLLEADLTTLFNLIKDPPAIGQLNPRQGRSSLRSEIYIYGENFAAGVVAQLGGKSLATTRYDTTRISATVPAGLLGVGTHTLVVTNPGGKYASLANAYTVIPEVSDDLYGYGYELWSNPPTLQANQSGQIGLVVHRQGGTSPLNNVAVRFYRGDPAAGGVLLGTATVSVLNPRGAQSTSAVTWPSVPAGVYSIYAEIDPTNAVSETIELNNRLSRAITVMPSAPDTTPPVVSNLLINGGAKTISNAAVTITTSAYDSGGSGLAQLQFVQYQYSPGADTWTAVQNSGWMAYASSSNSFHWNLVPTIGMIYVKAWAMDCAGNISAAPYATLLNYIPASIGIVAGQVNIYRYQLSQGQPITVRLTPSSGDQDLYIWSPDHATRAPYISNQAGVAVDQISFAAPVAGLYQVEVRVASGGTYSLSVNIGGSSAGAGYGSAAAAKPVYTEPYVALESEPGNYYALTPEISVATLWSLYLPLIKR